MSHQIIQDFVVRARLDWLGNESTHSQPSLARGTVKMNGYKTYLSVERERGVEACLRRREFVPSHLNVVTAQGYYTLTVAKLLSVALPLVSLTSKFGCTTGILHG
jgi:hypothetical protein